MGGKKKIHQLEALFGPIMKLPWSKITGNQSPIVGSHTADEEEHFAPPCIRKILWRSSTGSSDFWTINSSSITQFRFGMIRWVLRNGVDLAIFLGGGWLFLLYNQIEQQGEGWAPTSYLFPFRLPIMLFNHRFFMKFLPICFLQKCLVIGLFLFHHKACYKTRVFHFRWPQKCHQFIPLLVLPPYLKVTTLKILRSRWPDVLGEGDGGVLLGGQTGSKLCMQLDAFQKIRCSYV